MNFWNLEDYRFTHSEKNTLVLYTRAALVIKLYTSLSKNQIYDWTEKYSPPAMFFGQRSSWISAHEKCLPYNLHGLFCSFFGCFLYEICTAAFVLLFFFVWVVLEVVLHQAGSKGHLSQMTVKYSISLLSTLFWP